MVEVPKKWNRNLLLFLPFIFNMNNVTLPTLQLSLDQDSFIIEIDLLTCKRGTSIAYLLHNTNTKLSFIPLQAGIISSHGQLRSPCSSLFLQDTMGLNSSFYLPGNYVLQNSSYAFNSKFIQ